MISEATSNQRYALLVEVGPNGCGALVTNGWVTLVRSDSPDMLAHFMLRQATYLAEAGGKAILAAIEGKGGSTKLKPIMDHSGNSDPECPVRVVPRTLSPAEAGEWCARFESYAANASRERAWQGSPVASAASAQNPVPMRVPARLASKVRRNVGRIGFPTLTQVAAGFVLVAIGAGGAYALTSFEGMSHASEARQEPAFSFDDGLAQGGTVRRLQGIAQAMGRRY